MLSPRVLFILKQRPQGPYGNWNYSCDGKPLTSGLSNSASQMEIGLRELGIATKLVQVVDNNSIDREVTLYSPTHVIIEAFWVVPEKFNILKKLHPAVTWIVRNHSKSDFLSHEGGMIGWAIDYINNGVYLGCNSPEATLDFKRLAFSSGADPQNVIFLPNYYDAGIISGPLKYLKLKFWKLLRFCGVYEKAPAVKTFLHIGCFGAVRPLKNHLQQATAAIEVAERLNTPLKFYINANRVEGKAESILTSLRQLFKRFPKHELVELGWMEHDVFKLIVKDMDLVMQVSNSETFNIVSADAVSQGVPVLVSDQIPWLDCEYHANPNDVQDIIEKLQYVYRNTGTKHLVHDQLCELQEYSMKSLVRWQAFIKPVKFVEPNAFYNGWM